MMKLGMSRDELVTALEQSLSSSDFFSAPDRQGVLKDVAAAVGDLIDRNNKKVASDLTEQVTRFMSGMGRGF